MPKEYDAGTYPLRSPYADETTLFRILTLGEIYEIPVIAESLQELRKYIRVSDDHYDLFYRATIDRFLECVQLLPDTSGKRTRSLALEGLGRAIKAAIFTHKSYRIDELEVFALVSSALLRHIGSLVSSMEIMVSREDGECAQHFNPLYHKWGEHRETHYRVRYCVEPNLLLRQQVSLLMAQRILPELAFTWLSDHAHVFSNWLALINEDEHDAGTLGSEANLVAKAENTFLKYLYQHDLFIDDNFGDIFPLDEEDYFDESLANQLDEENPDVGSVDDETTRGDDDSEISCLCDIDEEFPLQEEMIDEISAEETVVENDPDPDMFELAELQAILEELLDDWEEEEEALTEDEQETEERDGALEAVDEQLQELDEQVDEGNQDSSENEVDPDQSDSTTEEIELSYYQDDEGSLVSAIISLWQEVPACTMLSGLLLVLLVSLFLVMTLNNDCSSSMDRHDAQIWA